MDNAALLSSSLYGLLAGLDASDIAEVFLWLLLVGFFAAVALTRLSRAPRFVGYAPTLLTSLGILGTFVGIVVGLMHFDPKDIDASIPALLAGLKTAFITSLAGMGSAIMFKVLWTTPVINPPRKGKELEGAGPEEILGALVQQNETLAGLRTAIAGSEETSLVGQLKLLRSDQNDQHKEVMGGIEKDRETLNQFAGQLWQRLEQFAEMLSKSATEQVINALREVIIEFNQKLTEQFGDNFKALDASVQKLVQWQENYRVQLEQMSAQYAQGVEAITQTESSVAHISEESRQIPVTMQTLKEVLEVNQHQLAELRNHLEAFRDMRDRAVAAVPQIREQVEQTVSSVAASVEAANDHYVQLIDRSDAYMKAHDAKTGELLQRLVKTTEEGIEMVRGGLEKGAAEVQTAIAGSAEGLSNSVQGLLADSEKQLKVSLEAANDHQLKLIERSTELAKEHDAKTGELLERLVKTTDEGIEMVRGGLEKGAAEVQTAIKGSADELAITVHSLLTDSSNQMAESVNAASEHHTKLLDRSDAYIEAHDQQTRTLLDRFVQTTNEGIDKVRDGLESSASQVKTAIVTGAEELDNSVQRLQANLTSTSDQIATQSEQIRAHLDDTLTEVNEHVRAMLGTLSEESKGLASTLKATGEQVQRDTQATQQQVADSISQMQSRLEGALEEVFAAQTRAMNGVVEGVLEEMRRAVSTTGEGVNQQLSAIDEAMQKEINRVMNEMGKALAQISGRFTDDYSKLVAAMGHIAGQGSNATAHAGRVQ
jgi:chromosome segregation ATPase